ncbi:MAG TPA: DUF5908 family protein [Puia sp.]|jgi:hypothetical protein|nr:DUF5908 family protein [Puia sp.]
MPIEIRELVIKATVQQDTGGPGKPPQPPEQNNNVGNNEMLVQACVDKLTEIINSRYER